MTGQFRCMDCGDVAPYRPRCACGGGLFTPHDGVAYAVLKTTRQAPFGLMTATLDVLRYHIQPAPANDRQPLGVAERARRLIALTRELGDASRAAVADSMALLRRLP